MTDQWSAAEERELKKIAAPERVQSFLDSIPYRCADEYPAPLAVLREKTAHCFDGATFAAAALRRGGFEPVVVNLRAVRDDDHLLCIYQWRKKIGAVAKSNFPGLRFREPVFRNLHELVLSYFEFYFNLEGEKTLRAFSRPLRLSKFEKYNWECSPIASEKIIDALDASPHTELLERGQEKKLQTLDDRLYRSQLVGVKKAGVTKYS